MKVRMIIMMCCLALLQAKASHADLQWLKNKVADIKSAEIKKAQETSLADTKIAEGLREALKIGIDNAVKATSQKDGFLGNPEIKITMPEKLQVMDQALRKLGMGPRVDEFIVSMNRAAEKAAPQARDIFIDGIMTMNVKDAQAILKGGDSAATQYFKNKTRAKLVAAVQPIIKQRLNELAVTQKYNELVIKYKMLPFTSKYQAPDITEYVVNKSLDGIFHVLAQEEARIRNDPKAQVTALLKEVFRK